MSTIIPFLAAKTEGLGTAGILGAALDLTESCRAGTRAAPGRIRAVSDMLESYSPLLDRDLEDMHLVDWGDVPLQGLPMAAALDQIQGRFEAVLRPGFGILLGGEHTVALAGYRAARAVYPDAALIQFDAHADLREEFEGEAFCHATWAYQAGTEFGFENIVQLGIRSGTRAEFSRARSCLFSSSGLEIPESVRAQLRGRPVYVSLDIDVLDPGSAPGTGCPEPGGVLFRELAACLYGLEPLRVIGADICEVLPDTDPASITALSAAKAVRELVLLFGWPETRERASSQPLRQRAK